MKPPDANIPTPQKPEEDKPTTVKGTLWALTSILLIMALAILVMPCNFQAPIAYRVIEKVLTDGGHL
jgi:hypothetical protein